MMNIAIDCLRKYQLSTTFAISMNEPRVLITGFSKFSDFKYNISEKVVDMIRGIKFNNFVTSSEILSVNQEGASLVANKIYSGEGGVLISLRKNIFRRRGEKFCRCFILYQCINKSCKI